MDEQTRQTFEERNADWLLASALREAAWAMEARRRSSAVSTSVSPDGDDEDGH